MGAIAFTSFIFAIVIMAAFADHKENLRIKDWCRAHNYEAWTPDRIKTVCLSTDGRIIIPK